MSLLSICELCFFLNEYIYKIYIKYNLSKLGGALSQFRADELTKAKDSGIFHPGQHIIL